MKKSFLTAYELHSSLKREKFESYKPAIQKTDDFTFLVSPLKNYLKIITDEAL